MVATTKPDLTRVWANGAPAANVVDPDNTIPGKVDAGWSAEVPPFEHFNFLQKWFTQGLAHANEQGIMVWDTNTVYPVGGMAKGSDGNIYKCIVEQNGNDPISDNINWVTFKTYLTPDDLGYDGTNAGTVINAALAKGIAIQLLAKTYVVDTPILVDTNATIVGMGDGWSKSVLEAAATLTGNVIDTVNYAALVSGNIVEGNPASGLACPTGMVLRDFAIRGNKDTYPGGFAACTQGNGMGIRLYGKQFQLYNIRVNNVANVGVYTRLSTLGTFDSPFDPEPNAKAGHMQNIVVYDTGRENFIFRGPSDIWLNNIYGGYAFDGRDNLVVNPSADSLEEVGIGAHGCVIRTSVEIGWMHIFGCVQGFGVWVNGEAAPSTVVRLRFQYLMGESNYGNIYFGDRVRYSGNLLESHANIWGDGANEHILIESTQGGAISNIDIYRDSNEHGSTGIKVDGSPLAATIKFNFSGSWDLTGHGCDIQGFGHEIHIVSLSGGAGLAKDGTESTGIIFRDIFDNSVVSASIRAYNHGVRFEGSVSNSQLRLNVRDSVAVGFNGYAFLQEYTRLDSSLIEQNTASSGLTKRSKFKGQVEVDNTLSTQQIVSIAHNLIGTPLKRDVQLTSYFNTGSLPVIQRLWTNDVDATTIDVGFKGDGSGGVGLTRIAVQVI